MTENEEEESEEEQPEEDQTMQAEETKETPKPRQPSNEIKLVIVMKDDDIMLGVQSPDCDPVYDTMTGDLAAALKKVPKLVTKAKQKWVTDPRYPQANLPEPAPSAAPAHTPAAAKPKSQPAMF